MDREHGASAQPWGTLEELLLACAVNRHGTTSWDSIAMELQRRCSTLPSTLTPQYCRDKYDDLKKRFMPGNDDESASVLTMVDELRRIRVEDLRREVLRRDLSIVSLELKVKRLEEDRERSLKEEAEAVDLKKDLEGDGRETAPEPDNLAGKSFSDDKDNRSFNESNSTSQRGDGQGPPRNGVVAEQVRPEPVGTEPDPGRSGPAPGNDSSFDNNGKEEEEDIDVKASGSGRLGEVESVGESKREKEATSKQSSDVQSSVSLSRKKRRRRGGGVVGSSSSGDCEEPEGDEVSPATKRASAVKSETLVKLLGIIRSHRLGSSFERRLRSQESERYKSLIRQHMDLQTVQSRLDRGVYKECIHKFFRDVLLIFNNGVIFFRKGSSEHVAAKELRALVCKELTNKLPKKFKARTVKPEPKQEPDSLPKPNKSSTIVACGKRSSMKALITEGVNRKVDKREKELEEKPNVTQKKNDVSFVKMEEKGIRKKRSKERMGRRSSRMSNKGGDIKHEYGGNELSSHDALEVKMEKKENIVKKKAGAASFLKRMKQNSPNEMIEDDDTSEDDSKEVRREEEKKRRGKKREGIKREERVTRSSSGGRGGKENAKVKRGVGRPPKRPEPVAVAAAGKRGRENGESEVVGGGAGRSRKRSRR